MIKAHRLFLLPSIAMFFLLVPFIGIVITMLILLIWFTRNSDDIFLYFKGQNYRQNELSKEELENDKFI